jgi:hypothetical protein
MSSNSRIAISKGHFAIFWMYRRITFKTRVWHLGQRQFHEPPAIGWPSKEPHISHLDMQPLGIYGTQKLFLQLRLILWFLVPSLLLLNGICFFHLTFGFSGSRN